MVKTEIRTPDPEGTPHAFVAAKDQATGLRCCEVCGRGSGHHIHDAPEVDPDIPHVFIQSDPSSEDYTGPYCGVCGMDKGHVIHIHDAPAPAHTYPFPIPDAPDPVNTPHPFKHGGFHGFPTVCGTCGHNREHRLHHAPEDTATVDVIGQRKYRPVAPADIWVTAANVVAANTPAPDPVNHPAHYMSHPSGVEVIQITEHLGFCLGNVVKYVLRADHKGDAVTDLEKARWYLDREIKRRKGE